MVAPAIRRCRCSCRCHCRRGCRWSRRWRRRFEFGVKDLFILSLVYFLSLQESSFEGLRSLPSLASVGLLQKRGMSWIFHQHTYALKIGFFVPISVSLRLTFPTHPPRPSSRGSRSSILFIFICRKLQRHCRRLLSKIFFTHLNLLNFVSAIRDEKRLCHYNAMEWRVMETVMDHMPRPNCGVRSVCVTLKSSQLKSIAICNIWDYRSTT